MPNISEDDQEQFENMKKDPQIYDKICKSVAPSIYGHADIKKAIKSGEIKPLDAKAVLGQRVTGRALQARFQGAGETIFGKTKREQGIINYNIAALNQLKNKIADKRAKLESYSDFADSDSRVISELKARRAELDKAESSVQNELTRLLTDLSEETAGF